MDILAAPPDKKFKNSCVLQRRISSVSAGLLTHLDIMILNGSPTSLFFHLLQEFNMLENL
jgi:hypothetical protein